MANPRPLTEQPLPSSWLMIIIFLANPRPLPTNLRPPPPGHAAAGWDTGGRHPARHRAHARGGDVLLVLPGVGVQTLPRHLPLLRRHALLQASHIRGPEVNAPEIVYSRTSSIKATREDWG